MRRLMEECTIGQGNASLLSQALVFAKPENLKKDQIITVCLFVLLGYTHSPCRVPFSVQPVRLGEA